MSVALVKFIITSLFFGSIVVIISIAWPRFMNSTRPEPIAKVYSAISQTQIGRDIGAVLGVSVDGSGAPFNLETEVQRLSNMAVSMVESQAKTAIARHAVIQLKNQFDSLSPEMKMEIQHAICSSSSSVLASESGTIVQ